MKKITLLLGVVLSFVLFTRVSGQSWTKMDVPALEGKWSLNGIHFTSATNGWAVGYFDESTVSKGDSKGLVLQFKNGNWVKADIAAPSANWTLHGVWFLNDNEGWVFGQNKETMKGLLLHYKSGSWEQVDPGMVATKEWKLFDVFFLNSNEGWAVGGSDGKDSPVLLHFANGNWSVETSKEFSKQTVLAIHALSPDNVYAGGFREGEWGLTGASRAQGSFVISKSTADWEAAKLPLLSKNIICHDIVCIDANNVYAVGWMPAFQNAPETGKVLYFNGKKWSEGTVEGTPKEWNLMSAAFESADKGWAVGFSENKGILVEINKGKWIAIGKKSEPQVSDKWQLRAVSYDGAANYYTAGVDLKTEKGIILLLNK